LQIIPLSERPVEFRFHLVSSEKLRGIQNGKLWFVDMMRNQKKILTRCPFEEKNT